MQFKWLLVFTFLSLLLQNYAHPTLLIWPMLLYSLNFSMPRLTWGIPQATSGGGSQDGSTGRLWTHLLLRTRPIYNYSWKNYHWDRTDNWIRGTPATTDNLNWGRRERNSLLERKNATFTSRSTSRLPRGHPKVRSPPWRSGALSRGAIPLWAFCGPSTIETSGRITDFACY